MRRQCHLTGIMTQPHCRANITMLLHCHQTIFSMPLIWGQQPATSEFCSVPHRNLDVSKFWLLIRHTHQQANDIK